MAPNTVGSSDALIQPADNQEGSDVCESKLKFCIESRDIGTLMTLGVLLERLKTPAHGGLKRNRDQGWLNHRFVDQLQRFFDPSG